MPTTVDALIVTLGLDARNFTDEQKKALEAFNKSQDAVERRLKGLEERNRKSAQSFGDATHAAEGLFTVLAGAGIVSFARDVVNSAAGAGRMATNIGQATNELSAFGRMIERNGGNAEAATGSMKGLVDQMQRAKWGQTSPDFLMGLSQVGAGIEDSPIAVAMKLARFAERNSVQDVNLTGQRLGLSQDIINAALKGSVKMLEEYKKAAEGAVSPEQVKKLTELQRSWVALDQSIRMVGTDIVSNAAPGFARAADAVSGWVNANRDAAGVLGTILALLTAIAAIRLPGKLLGALGRAAGLPAAGLPAAGGAAPKVGKGGAPVGKGGGLGNVSLSAAVTAVELANDEDFLRETGIRKALDAQLGKTMPKAAAPEPAPSPRSPDPVPPPAPGDRIAFQSKAEKEAFIRAEAARLKIEPEVAFRVAKSEGFDNFRSTIFEKPKVPGGEPERERSFGAFQLHVTPGGRGRAVGDQFREKTGLDPSDPATEKAGITFALEWAKQHGWGDFHGAANTGIGKWEGIRSGGGATTVTIENLNIKTDSRDPREHGRLAAEEIKGRLSGGAGFSQSIATNANSGQRP